MGDSAYGSAEMLGWLVDEHGIEPHVTVFDKSARKSGHRRSKHWATSFAVGPSTLWGHKASVCNIAWRMLDSSSCPPARHAPTNNLYANFGGPFRNIGSRVMRLPHKR